MTALIAHRTTDSDGTVREHDLLSHLNCVAEQAATFAGTTGADWAQLAGLWHDLGKYRPGFQRYIRESDDAHIEGKVAGPDKTHSAAGALHALQALSERFGDEGRRAGWLLAHLIAAHHAGLYDRNELADRLFGSNAQNSERERRDAVDVCSVAAPSLLAPPDALAPRQALLGAPGLRDQEPLAQSLWLRMLFSSLVDADFLDTEAFVDPDRQARRNGFPPLTEYLQRLGAHLGQKAAQVHAEGRHDDPVMRARAQVLEDCRAAALQPPGVYSLQVPTGGGKTFASLAFALRHCEAQGLERVIVAIPYTSIVEQTADEFAKVFGRDNFVEHHSQADTPENRETTRSRLACENWDAPLVVTTNVQLFESLFAARTSRCRKLHRIQRSVIILDEAQTLPPQYLQPTLDALRLLVRYYGATVVSCTATQPVLSDIERFDVRKRVRGLTRDGAKPVEIVRDVRGLYDGLERVRLHWPTDLHAVEDVAAVAQRLAAHEAVLAIVNTRRDAAELVRALDAAAPDGTRTLHLSAAMCGQHRADVIAQIRHRLYARARGDAAPLRVVATQVVEAGVDIDFPVVFRALAGLDAIAQAAGRCNREGLLGPRGGYVEVFVRPIPAALATLRRAAQATLSVLGDDRPVALPPELFARYFEHWYDQFEVDEKHVLDMLRASHEFDLRLRSAAKAYRLIDDEDQVAVVVPYKPASGESKRIEYARAALQRGQPERRHLRDLQRLIVQVRRRQVAEDLARGDFVEPVSGWLVLRNDIRYDNRFGLLAQGAVLDPQTLTQ